MVNKIKLLLMELNCIIKTTRTATCVVFANQKGGTGKTTSCLSTAGWLAKSGARVLVVDFDSQANATSYFGIDVKSLEHSIYDAVLMRCGGYKGMPITSVILETSVEKIHIAPSELNLGVAELLMYRARNRIDILNDILKDVGGLYDYILIDLPPSSGLLTLNGLRAADHVVALLEPSVYSIEALGDLKTLIGEIEQMTNHTIDSVTAVLCRYVKPGVFSRLSGKQTPSKEVEVKFNEMFPLLNLHIVPESDKIYEAQRVKLPVSHVAPKSEVARAYLKLTKSITDAHHKYDLGMAEK